MAHVAKTLKRAGRRSRRWRRQGGRSPFWPHQAGQRLEPIFLRGLDKAKAEWALICTVNNLLKLANANAKA